MNGFIPPSSPTNLLSPLPAFIDRILPTSVEPVKLITPISLECISCLMISLSLVFKKHIRWSSFSKPITSSNLDAVLIPNSGGLIIAPAPEPIQFAILRVIPARGSL